jgi:Fe-S cluster biosynthesis and repair protein YggX
MTRTIFCKKLGTKELGLESPPFLPGDLGKQIFDQISQRAWQMWLDHQTMLINEYRLNTRDLDARKRLMTELKKFLFGEDTESQLTTDK